MATLTRSKRRRTSEGAETETIKARFDNLQSLLAKVEDVRLFLLACQPVDLLCIMETLSMPSRVTNFSLPAAISVSPSDPRRLVFEGKLVSAEASAKMIKACFAADRGSALVLECEDGDLLVPRFSVHDGWYRSASRSFRIPDSLDRILPCIQLLKQFAEAMVPITMGQLRICGTALSAMAKMTPSEIDPLLEYVKALEPNQRVPWMNQDTPKLSKTCSSFLTTLTTLAYNALPPVDLITEAPPELPASVLCNILAGHPQIGYPLLKGSKRFFTERGGEAVAVKLGEAKDTDLVQCTRRYVTGPELSRLSLDSRVFVEPVYSAKSVGNKPVKGDLVRTTEVAAVSLKKLALRTHPKDSAKAAGGESKKAEPVQAELEDAGF